MPLKFDIIEQTVRFEASPADVFDALLNPENTPNSPDPRNH